MNTNTLSKKDLIETFDKMQQKYGSPILNSVYGGGAEVNPELCLVFINPTARNIATKKDWKGIRCQWLGTKQVWKFLSSVGIFDENLNAQIQAMKPKEWTPEFCEKVYDEVKRRSVYITNLAKCTLDDARPLPESVLAEYRDLLLREIDLVNPKKVILFGNQVSSVVLGKKVSVSMHRKESADLIVGDKTFKCYPGYYPVGNGFFNAPKAIEDLRYIANLKEGL